MPKARVKTLGDALIEVRELQERAAVQKALVAYLRTRYLPRDSMKASAQITCGKAPVSEAMIETVAEELDQGANEILKQADLYMKTELEDGE